MGWRQEPMPIHLCPQKEHLLRWWWPNECGVTICVLAIKRKNLVRAIFRVGRKHFLSFSSITNLIIGVCLFSYWSTMQASGRCDRYHTPDDQQQWKSSESPPPEQEKNGERLTKVSKRVYATSDSGSCRSQHKQSKWKWINGTLHSKIC